MHTALYVEVSLLADFTPHGQTLVEVIFQEGHCQNKVG